MRKKSTELYPYQRSKEKRELFRRFRYRVIENVYKKKFFALFNHRCFKCGAKEKPAPEIGQPPILCIDHHIPMALGGHLVPGNLVALCRRCNNKKLDLPPEEFYSSMELERLKPILDRQEEVFSFTFDYDLWEDDRQNYLLSIGVDAGLVQEILFNQEHPEYIGTESHRIGITIAIDLGEYSEKNNR